MEVFLTGATGFIGSQVAQAFRRAGYRVLGLTRSQEKARELAAREIEPVLGDLAEPASYLPAARRASLLVHCAAESSRDAVARDRQAIETLLAAAREARAPRHLIYTSGVWVLGSTGDRVATDDSPLAPFGFVAWRQTHEELVLAADSEELHTDILRPGCVFGRSGSLTGYWFESAAKGEVEIVGDGRNHWSMIHVDDLARAYVLLARQPRHGLALNLNDGTQATVGEMAAAVANVAGVPGRVRSLTAEEARSRFGRIAEGLSADQRVSAERARRILGWAPRHAPFADDADLCYAAWKAHAR